MNSTKIIRIYQPVLIVLILILLKKINLKILQLIHQIVVLIMMACQTCNLHYLTVQIQIQIQIQKQNPIMKVNLAGLGLRVNQAL